MRFRESTWLHANNRAYLLGHDVPALSNPARSHEVISFSADPDDTNTDMPDKLKTDNWGNWEHSDLKNEPMGHACKLFSDMVSRGKPLGTVIATQKLSQILHISPSQAHLWSARENLDRYRHA